MTYEHESHVDPGVLHIYVVRTANGEREWHAEDTQHAREQHDDAFAGEPGETIIAIRRQEP